MYEIKKKCLLQALQNQKKKKSRKLKTFLNLIALHFSTRLHWYQLCQSSASASASQSSTGAS